MYLIEVHIVFRIHKQQSIKKTKEEVVNVFNVAYYLARMRSADHLSIRTD